MTQRLDLIRPGRGDRAGAVLVAHAWWGLNAATRNYAESLAAAGFLVGLVDLYGGRTADSLAGAERLRDAETMEIYGARLAEAAARMVVVNAGLPIGIVGFSLGGFLALGLVAKGAPAIGAVVTYYATRDMDFAATGCRFLAHFAAHDDFESDADRIAMEAALATTTPPSSSFVYPQTRHWFAESDRPEYSRPAADLSFARTVTFLRANRP